MTGKNPPWQLAAYTVLLRNSFSPSDCELGLRFIARRRGENGQGRLKQLCWGSVLITHRMMALQVSPVQCSLLAGAAERVPIAQLQSKPHYQRKVQGSTSMWDSSDSRPYFEDDLLPRSPIPSGT